MLSRQTLELCRQIVAAQQLQVGHPQFVQAAQFHAMALVELNKALAEPASGLSVDVPLLDQLQGE